MFSLRCQWHTMRVGFIVIFCMLHAGRLQIHQMAKVSQQPNRAVETTIDFSHIKLIIFRLSRPFALVYIFLLVFMWYSTVICLNFSSLYQRTPLHMAVEGGHVEIIKYLVQKGAQVNIQDEAGVSITCKYSRKIS